MRNIKSLKWLDLLGLFGIPTILNYLACQVAIPFFKNNTQLPIEIVYFICVGTVVLMPMFLGAIYLTGREIGSFKMVDIFERMRIKKLSRKDVLWTVIAFILLCLGSFLIAKIIMPAIRLDANPFFFQNMPLVKGYWWILYVWPLFFLFNIFGEEFLWRGYIQPRQELLNGKWTWFVHGSLWSVWHIPMGLDLVITAIPILFILPAIVQIRKNTTIAIVVHFIFGSFGFLALALGAVH